MSGKDTADQHLPLLYSTGTNEQVASLVADPEQLQAARRRLPIVAFDQTPVWLKLRAEDKVMLSISDLQQSSLRRSLSDKFGQPGLSPADREQASAEMQLWCQRNPNLQQESHHKISQGGDKHRLTLVTFQMVHSWFDPDCEPRGSIPGSLLIVPCAQHCRLEDIDQDGKWSKDVTSMFEGWLGEPFYGMEPAKAADSRKKWNSLADAIVGKGGKRIKGRPGTHAAKINLADVRAELEQKLKKKPTEDDVWSYLMYPDVFLKFADFRKTYGDVAALPTPAYYYGLRDKEEIHINLEEGKTLFVRLLNMTEPDPAGQQTAIFELNGFPRHTTVTNKSLAVNTVSKVKADPADPTQVGAPMPGMVASIAVTVGQKVKEGETVVTLEAMKMFAAISAPASGTVQEICIKIGDNVESKDLLVRLGK